MPGGWLSEKTRMIAMPHPDTNSTFPRFSGRALDRATLIDAHCHLLYAIDDGAQSLQDSLQMARLAVKDGTTAVICTPHASSANLLQLLTQRDAVLDSLRSSLQEENIPLSLIPGCEYYADTHTIETALSTPQAHLAAHPKAPLLVELPMNLHFPLIADLTFQAETKGVSLALAHPSRYDGFLENLDLLKKCMDHGLWLQCNAEAFSIGFLCFHPFASATLKLMAHNPSQIILGSDAHDPVERQPLLSTAKRAVIKKLGMEAWEQIAYKNLVPFL